MPIVVHVLTLPTKLPGPLTFVNVTSVPAGAFTKPPTALMFTCPVSV